MIVWNLFWFIWPRPVGKSVVAGDAESGASIDILDESSPGKGGLLAVATPSSGGRVLNVLGSSAASSK